MKLVLIVGILAFLQASPPKPGQATQEGGKKSQTGHSKSTDNKTPTEQPEAVQNPRESKIAQPDASANACADKQESKAVRVAPVEVNKDWTDYLYILASLLLTIATFVIAIYAAVQARAAKRSAENDERTVRLTERADILLDDAGFETPSGHIDVRSRITLSFKNFGRTRANNVALNVRLIIPGVPNVPVLKEIPKINIGAGETKEVKFQSFGDVTTQFVLRNILEGNTTLQFVGEIAYDDVFGGHHIVDCEGEYHPQLRSFECTKNCERT